MMNVKKLVRQLQKERDKMEKQLSGLNAALTAFANVYTGKTGGTRRELSEKAKAKIAVAQRKRWAAWKAKQKKA